MSNRPIKQEQTPLQISLEDIKCVETPENVQEAIEFFTRLSTFHRLRGETDMANCYLDSVVYACARLKNKL